jgi:hypothetical protein
MSKAEDLAKEFLKKLVSHATLYKGTIDELEVYEPDDVIWAYKEGYHQAEKDLELTWENMFDIFRLVNEVLDDFAEGKTKKEVGEEVLKRFKDLKKGKRNENVHN